MCSKLDRTNSRAGGTSPRQGITLLGSFPVVKVGVKWGGGQSSRTMRLPGPAHCYLSWAGAWGCCRAPMDRKPGRATASQLTLFVAFSAVSSGGTCSLSPGWREAAAHLEGSHSGGCICPCHKVMQYLLGAREFSPGAGDRPMQHCLGLLSPGEPCKAHTGWGDPLVVPDWFLGGLASRAWSQVHWCRPQCCTRSHLARQ